MSPRRLLLSLVGVLLLIATTACEGATVVKDDDKRPLPSAASNEGDTEIWDLRQRPTAEQLGIAADDETAVYEARPSRPVRLRLAGAETVELPTRYVAFSTIGSPEGEPVSVDVKTETMSLDETGATFRSVLEQLGLPTSKVGQFVRDARDATGTTWVRTDRVAGRFGDLDLGVVARYSPNSEHGLVALGGGWLRLDD